MTLKSNLALSIVKHLGCLKLLVLSGSVNTPCLATSLVIQSEAGCGLRVNQEVTSDSTTVAV